MVGPARPSSDDETPPLAQPGQKRSSGAKAPGKRIRSAEDAISGVVTLLSSPSKPIITRSVTRGAARAAKKTETVKERGVKRSADPDMAESLPKMQERPLPANLLELSPEALQHLLEVIAKYEQVDVDTIRNWVSSLDVSELAKRSDLDSFKEIFKIAERKCPSEFRDVVANLSQNANVKIQQAIGIRVNAISAALAADISPDVLRSTIDDAFTFSVPDFMQSTHLNELESSVQKIFDERCKGVAGYLKSWSAHTFEGRCASVLESIQTAKVEDQRDVQELLQSRPFLTQPFLKDIERDKILTIFLETARDERATLVTQLEALLRGVFNEDSQSEILSAVIKIPRAERVEVLRLAQPLLVGVWSSQKRVAILSIVIEIPPAERAEMVGLIQSFMTGISYYGLEELVTFLKKIPQAERIEALKLAQPLWSGVTDNFFQREAVLGEVIKIPQAQRAELWQLAQPLLVEITVYHDRVAVLNAVTAMSEADRALFITAMSRADRIYITALKDFIAGVDRFYMIDLLASACQLSPVALRLTQTFCGQGGPYEKREIVHTVIKIPEAEREEVLELAQSLVAVGATGYERAAVLRAIAKIPQAERVEMLRLVQPYLANEDGYEQASILRAIRKIPKAEREDVVRLAQPLLVGVEDRHQRASILRAVIVIPQAEREEVLGIAQSLWVGLENNNERAEVLLAVRDIPQAGRADVLRLAQPLLILSRSGEDIAVVLGHVADTPHAEREQKVAALRALIAGVDASQVAALFALTYQLPRELRDRVIEIITALPSDQRLAEMRSVLASLNDYRITDTRYLIRIERHQLTELPRVALHNLTELFKAGVRSELSVAFLGEEGADAGGLSREFLSLLFEGIKDAMKFNLLANGLYRPVLPVAAVMSDEDKLSYNELGTLMMFCLAADQDYPIGMIFDEGVFIALKALVNSSNLDSGEFTFDELFAVYTAMNSSNEKDRAMIQRMNECLAPLSPDTSDKTLKDLFSIVEYEDGIEELNINMSDVSTIREHFPVLQAALRHQLEVEKVRSTMAPLIEIARGMKSAPFAKTALDLDATKLSVKLQGIVTRELILSKLEFRGFSGEKATWMRNWISTTSDEKIKQFLHAMTGSNALGKVNLKVANGGDNIYFHTCFNSVDIPLDIIENEEALHSLIESTIGGREGYSRA